MDELMFTLQSNYLKKAIGKIVSNAIFKKIGYRVEVNIDKLNIDHKNGETSVAAGVDLKLQSGEFFKILKALENS